MSSRPKLRLDWCSHEAAKYAVEHWHYSRTMPVSKSVKVGVWEDGEFVGCIIFAWGANPSMSKTIGLAMTQCAELVRVALRTHVTPVSRMIAIASRMLRKQSPGLRAFVSYADPYHGHHGGIYQAGGWIYLGKTQHETRFLHHGKMLQRRAFSGKNFGRGPMKLPGGACRIVVPGKHKYILPFDSEVLARVIPLARAYPKRAGSLASEAPVIHAGQGGATPTPALQYESVAPFPDPELIAGCGL